MRMLFNFFTQCLVLIAFVFTSTNGYAQTDSIQKIYKFNIKEEIAPPIWRLTKNAFKEAREINADLILIHMNTYGGMLDAADSIRTMILESEIPVYVFIDNNAASAGALISIACDRIYMRSGANIGAATVVDQSGKPLPDKYQSYMRSLMRSTAEATGRNPDIAQAMVGSKKNIENVIDTGSVLTLTTSEAIENHYCEGKAENIDEVLKLAEINNYVITEQTITPLDRTIGFLIRPYISGILIVIIIAGIYFELQTPGVGFPSIAAIAAALLYFAPLYLEGLAENWEIILFIIGLVLVAIEIFAIPGFGFIGISGIILIVAGLTLSMVDSIILDGQLVNFTRLYQAFFTVVTAIFLSVVSSIWFSKKLFTSTIFGHLALDSTQKNENGFSTSDAEYKQMIDRLGVAQTNLRPAGKIQIDDKYFDATALTGFIEKGTKIMVVKYETAQLFVVKAE
ncbi:MAG: serine protease [Bacteroidetes bacterium HGW-Bacteroidetes-17]|nr:MAG: serine protease [Bacteroidetes bacterium HGW-Bacteroidetes-17]